MTKSPLIAALVGLTLLLPAAHGASAPGKKPEIFGVWLAISLEAYQVWDLWVILALVGWAAATELGRRSGNAIGAAFGRAEQLAAEGKDGPDAELAATVRSSQAQTLHWASTAITLLVLVDMIWKPGA